MSESAVTESPNGVSPETSPAEVQSVGDMFQYSAWVHVGQGAADCEDKENGSCGNPLHFHAWCRIPNSFQNANIRDKALAAKARKVRQLRDPNADSYEILEAEMEQITRAAERDQTGREMLVEEILGASFWRDQLRAIKELGEEDEWKTIREDQERLRHLNSVPEEERDADEFAELERHCAKYEEALKAKQDEISKPQRDALSGMEIVDLIEQIRDFRIEAEANEDYMRVYSLWEWYIGTLKPRPAEKGLPKERVFGDVNHLKEAAPEVIAALEETFAQLEAAMGSRSAVGNL